MNLEARKRMTAERFEHLRLLYNDRGYLVINECLDEIARLRKAIEKHRDAEGGGIHTYSWYDKELYKALDAIEAATKERE